jgi:hypothetical protein
LNTPIIDSFSEINSLHSEICALGRVTLEKAIRIGELLTGIKDLLPHGQWMRRLAEDVQFDERTVRRYMQVYRRREELKMLSGTSLSEAYRFLSNSRNHRDALKTVTVTDLPDARRVISDAKGKPIDSGVVEDGNTTRTDGTENGSSPSQAESGPVASEVAAFESRNARVESPLASATDTQEPSIATKDPDLVVDSEIPGGQPNSGCLADLKQAWSQANAADKAHFLAWLKETGEEQSGPDAPKPTRQVQSSSKGQLELTLA